MNQDELIELAKTHCSHGVIKSGGKIGFVFLPDQLQAFADLIRKEQIEIDACICENKEIPFDIDVWLQNTKQQMTAITANALAEAIRNQEL